MFWVNYEVSYRGNKTIRKQKHIKTVPLQRDRTEKN